MSFFQIVAKKEKSQNYDAGLALDDLSLFDCYLPRPTQADKCANGHEWRCQNKVC